MSQIITWTDEQLQSHFALWDKRTQQGEYGFMTLIEQFKYPWQGSGYSLECDGERVDLTLSQAQMVHEWLMSHVKRDESKPIPRDTQFAGLAKLLYEELDGRDYLWLDEKEEPEVLALLARRLYDFAQYVLDNIRFPYVKDIPDNHIA